MTTFRPPQFLARRAVSREAGLAAPGLPQPSGHCAGAASFTAEGDLTQLPRRARVTVNRYRLPRIRPHSQREAGA